MSFWKRKRLRTSANYTRERMLNDHLDSTALFLASRKDYDEIPVEPNNDDDIHPYDGPVETPLPDEKVETYYEVDDD